MFLHPMLSFPLDQYVLGFHLFISSVCSWNLGCGKNQTYLKLGNPENLKAGSSLLESQVSCVTSIVPTASGGQSFEHFNWNFNDGQNTLWWR
ncbi:hypothetical protein ACFX13_031861 [Malus domestica]